MADREAGAERGIVCDRAVEVDDRRDEGVEGDILLRLLPGREARRVEARGHAEEAEPATQRVVEHGEAAVGRVHHADDVHVRRHGERLVLVEQTKLLSALVGLDEHQQLAEDLRDVAAVDLVDHEEVGLARVILPRLFAESVERPLGEGEAACLGGPVAHHEVLV